MNSLKELPNFSIQSKENLNKAIKYIKYLSEVGIKSRSGALDHYVPLVPLQIQNKYVFCFINHRHNFITQHS